MRRTVLAVILVLLAVQSALATGFFLPADSRYAPLALESHRVTADINDQAALTRVVETFRNQHKANLEATFVFPLPSDAAVSDFKMYLNGELVTGEILGKERARGIYQSIVRQMRDPGLLEYMDSRLLKLSVFPVPAGGTQEVTVEYVQMLSAQDGLVRYTYPLKTPQPAARTMQDFTLTVEIASTAGIKNVYSPTHEAAVDRRDDKHASASFELAQAMLDRDFELYYTLSDSEFGASLLSSKSEGQDGHFLVLVSPRAGLSPADIKAKDVTFVFDVSGSMKGQKIEQAKKALEFCIRNLHSKDRFRIIVFRNFVRAMSGDLIEATVENRASARDYINRLQAEGGTDINEALQEALNCEAAGDRQHMIVFMTDGIPTAGKIRRKEIVDGVKKRNNASTRIFCFGVGDDVNTKLLDELTQLTGSYTEYVQEGETIDAKVATFFKRVGDPVLSNLTLDFGDADVYDVYPSGPQDLFAGSQLVIAGRYTKGGSAVVKMRGNGPTGAKEFEFPLEFTDTSISRKFVPQIWAQRKVAFLLREMRLNGENKELKDEVIRLSKEHGIMTPYTSYLVAERPARFARSAERESGLIVNMVQSGARTGDFDSREDAVRTRDMMTAVTEARMRRGVAGAGYSGGGQETGTLSRPPGESGGIVAQPVAESAVGGAFIFSTRPPVNYPDNWLEETTGGDAVRASAALNLALRSDKVLADGVTKKVAGRTFSVVHGVWVEKSVTKDHKVTSVKFGSAAYFELYDALPDLSEVFALGERLIIVAGDYALVIDPDVEDEDEAKGDIIAKVIEALKGE